MFNDRWVKVAFATRDKKHVNVGFEQAAQIVIYEISSLDARIADVLTYSVAAKETAAQAGTGAQGQCGKGSGGCGGGAKKDEAINEEEVTAKVASLAGASVLIVNKTLHAFSALALNHAKIFTVKVDEPEEIGNVIARLQEMLAGEPPLWLRRALNGSEAEQLVEPGVA